MNKNINLSIIIVHYGSGKEVDKCLASLAKAKPLLKNTEFILVDNNEEKVPNPAKKYKWIKYVKTPKNLGWGGGRNFGVKYAKGSYYFFLDSDVVIDPASVNKLHTFITKNKKVGLVSPKLVHISGKFAASATRELTPMRGIFYLTFLNQLFNKISLVQKYLMMDWDRKTRKKVDVAQLAAFIMRKSAYDSINGFDENLFLYFEENDVSMNLKKEGWQIYVLPEMEVLHLESKGTPKSTQEIKNIFNRSRFYYFKKHYGILTALVTETFARMSKETLFVFIILAVGTFLRFYRFIPNFQYGGEMGTDYMNIWNMLHGERTWLIGPRTSHEWFFISPIAYWIYALILLIGNYNIIPVSVFWGFVGSLAILVCHFVVKKLFDKNTALISSFLLAVSPAWIMQTRASRYNLVVAILFFPFLLFLQNSIKDKGKSLFKLGLILGLTMSFFPSPILLVPSAIVAFIFYKTKPKFKYILYSILGFIIPNISFLIYEAKNGFSITKQMAMWIPYRVLGFLGLYDKNTASTEVVSGSVLSIYKFFGESLAQNPGIFSFAIFIVIVGISMFLLFNLYKSREREVPFFLTMITLVVSYMGLFLHGNPPPHYYYVIFPIPLILTAYLINWFIKPRGFRILSVLTLGAISILSLIKSGYFYTDTKTVDYNLWFVPLSVQQQVVDVITKDSNGEPISIKRIGPNDYFEGDFAKNYIYLLTIKGVKIEPNSKITYTIIEGKESYKNITGINIFSEREVYVVKSK